ncbi:MAG: serine/threonine-protein kinase [Myxococcota bacterium]
MERAQSKIGPGSYGKYRLISRIASGGMAEVWLARSSSIGGFEKLLAIKRMHPHFGKNANLVSLFIEEAKLSVALNHPNIVQIFDFGQADGEYFIAMEYVDGLDLATLLVRARDKGAPLPVGISAYVIQKVLEGLAYAHGDKRGRRPAIIHRDVSPHNVLVSFEGLVKLSDFGIAKAVDDFVRERPGEVVGKSAYISPEQARGEPLSGLTDLWSTGVMLHETLTNRRLFSRLTEEDTLKAVFEDTVAPPSAINPHVPPELDRLALWLLERDAMKRPESARKAAEFLGGILREHYPSVDDYRLAEVITELWDGELPGPASQDISHARGLERTAQLVLEDIVDEVDAPAPANGKAPPAQDEALELAFEADPQELPVVDAVIQLKKAFLANPNLWTLFDIGRAYQDAGQKTRALGAYKLAAAKFAQAGLLVQAVTIATKIIEITGPIARTMNEIRRFPELNKLTDEALMLEIFDPSDASADFSEYHGLFRPKKIEPGELEPIDLYAPAPIFSSLTGDQLVEVIKVLARRSFPTGSKILEEGAAGTSFFWLGRGRVVVSTTNYEGRRVFLTSLNDGDYFGEQAFFTGEPRNANVDATEDVLALEISQEALQTVVRAYPDVEEGLRFFYKERIAESLLARSELFGHLSVRDRRMLASYFTFVNQRPGALIIREGERSDTFYAIKKGKVEVFLGGGASPMQLAILSAGQVFGEVAAVKGTPRTASVRAMTDCELLKMDGSDLKEFLAQNQEVRDMLEKQIEVRAEAVIQKLSE